MVSDREFHAVVYGATGYTGRLVADHLLKTYGDEGRTDVPDRELKTP